MNNLSTYLKNQLVNAALRGQAYTPPTAVYLHLYTSDPTKDDTGTEVSGNAYGAVQVAFGAPTDGVCLNTADVTFAQATGNWGAVTHGGLRDALSSGNLLWFGPLAASQNVQTGGVLQFKAGQISTGLA